MFTIEEIKTAHAKVKSGADFPKYVQDLIKIGVKQYSTYVSDGHTAYIGKDYFHIQSDAKYAAMSIATNSDKDLFKSYLKIHQQGGTDYPTFCRHSAETGVEKWTVDTNVMTCTYYDIAGNEMLVEQIPQR